MRLMFCALLGTLQSAQGQGLEARATGGQQELKLAVRLRVEITVIVNWIAQRLHMGTWTHLNHLLSWRRREKPVHEKPVQIV